MGRVLFRLDQVPDPLQEAIEPAIQPPVEQEEISPPGGRVLFRMDPIPEPEPTITETVGRGLLGEAELALTIGTGIGTDILGGLAGTIQGINPFAERGAAVEAFDFVKQFAFKPGPAGQEIAIGIGQIAETLTPDVVISMAKAFNEDLKFSQEDIFQKYGPVAATAFALVLPAVLETTAGYATIKRMRGLATTRADEAIQQTEDALRNSDTATFRTDIQPEDKTLKQISKDFETQNTQNLIDQIQPDPVLVQAAKDLGVDVNPSAFSNNQSFIAMEQGLKSKPGNELRQIENRAIEKLGERADELITKMGGEVEKGLLDVSIKNEFRKVIGDLEGRAAKDYEIVNKEIPKALPVIPATSRLYIEKRLEDLGGDKSLLNKSEKQLAGVLGIPKKEPKISEEGVSLDADVGEIELPSPSYGALDQVRRNVGNALEKKTGPYKDDEEAILNQVYGVLSNDQQGVADALGVGPVYERARNLVRLRKDIEKRSLVLFGKDLNDSLIPKLHTAVKQIGVGEITRFRKLMDALPPSQRQATSATFLNDLFTFGKRTGAPLGGGFVSAFEALARNPSLKKAIFDELPPEALKIFNDIGRVTTGIFKSKAFENPSGTANAILANLDSGAIQNKILKSRRLLSPFSLTGRALGFTAGILKRTLAPKTKTAAEFLTSAEFKISLENAALGKAVSAENITKTQKFKRWFKQQEIPTQKQIAAIGFIPWLLQDEDEAVDIEVSTEELRRRN